MLNSNYNGKCGDDRSSVRYFDGNFTFLKLCCIILTSPFGVQVDYFPAYFFMATAFFQVFEYSVLGTVVEIAVRM